MEIATRTTASRRNIFSIDAYRLLLIFFVTAIHCWIYPGRNAIMPILRTAVPSFFLISGYFLYSSDRTKVQIKIRGNISKLIILWVIGFLLCLPDVLLRCMRYDDYSRFIPDLSMPFFFIICCHQKIGFALWFLVALIEALLVMQMILSRGWDQHPKLQKEWLLPCLLLLIGILLNKYLCSVHPINNDTGIQYPPVLFTSWPLLYLGYQSHRYKNDIIGWAMKHQTLIVLIAISTAITSQIEGAYTPSTGDIYFSTLPLVYSLFLLLLLHPTVGGATMGRIGGRYALWIYILHVPVYNGIHCLLKTYEHWALHPAIIFLVSLVLAIPAEWIARRTLFRPKSASYEPSPRTRSYL